MTKCDYRKEHVTHIPGYEVEREGEMEGGGGGRMERVREID